MQNFAQALHQQKRKGRFATMKILLVSLFTLLSSLVLAQQAAAPKEAKYLPLYGQKALSDKDQKELVQFVESCDASFGSRKEAVEFFSERAWEFVSSGYLDTATYRFNLVQALDSQAVDSYWGLGVITFQRQDFPKAIEFLNKGLALDSTQSILRVDLAIVKLSCYLKNMDCGTLEETDSLLQQALLQTPNYATAWMKRAQVAYLQEKYENAWAYLHECRKLDITQLDIVLGNSLAEKMPDPQGVFK
jgi:tetratricopeptide (TPR) repeat protein